MRSSPLCRQENRKKRCRNTAKSHFCRSERAVPQQKEPDKTHYAQAKKRASQKKSEDLFRKNGRHLKNAEKLLKQTVDPAGRGRSSPMVSALDGTPKKLFLRSPCRPPASTRRSAASASAADRNVFPISPEATATGKTPCAGMARSSQNSRLQRAVPRPPLFASG